MSSLDEGAARRVRVLVVDDEPDVRHMLRPFLSSEGWRVEEASSGEEALASCRSDPPDVLVLDHKMPGLTGIEVARRLLEQGFDKPILMFSAYLSREMEAETAALGVPAVSKADLPGLVGGIRTLVTRAGSRSQT